MFDRRDMLYDFARQIARRFGWLQAREAERDAFVFFVHFLAGRTAAQMALHCLSKRRHAVAYFVPQRFDFTTAHERLLLGARFFQSAVREYAGEFGRRGARATSPSRSADRESR